MKVVSDSLVVGIFGLIIGGGGRRRRVFYCLLEVDEMARATEPRAVQILEGAWTGILGQEAHLRPCT